MKTCYWTRSEPPPCSHILHTCQWGYSHTKTFNSKPLSMICWWARLPLSSAATLAHALSTPMEVIWLGRPPSCCICWNSTNASWSCPHFICPNIIAVQETTLCNGILLNNLQASSMLLHLAYMSTRLFPTKMLDSQPLWTICWWIHLPSSRASWLAQAFRSPTNVTGSGCTLSCCICSKSSNVLCPCPHFTCLVIRAVQETTVHDGILLNTFCASSMLPQQTNQTQHHFDLFMHTPALFKSSYTSTCIQHLNKSEFVRFHAVLLQVLKQLHCLLGLPSLDILCKPFIPCKHVQLHCAWHHGCYLCIHPCWFATVIEPESKPCLLVSEIRIPHIHLHNQKSRNHELISHWKPSQIVQISHETLTDCADQPTNHHTAKKASDILQQAELQDPATSNRMLSSNQRLSWKNKKHDKHPDCEMAVEEREGKKSLRRPWSLSAAIASENCALGRWTTADCKSLADLQLRVVVVFLCSGGRGGLLLLSTQQNRCNSCNEDEAIIPWRRRIALSSRESRLLSLLLLAVQNTRKRRRCRSHAHTSSCLTRPMIEEEKDNGRRRELLIAGRGVCVTVIQDGADRRKDHLHLHQIHLNKGSILCLCLCLFLKIFLGQCIHGCKKCCTCLWRGFAFFYFSIPCLMVLVVCSCMQ